MLDYCKLFRLSLCFLSLFESGVPFWGDEVLDFFELVAGLVFVECDCESSVFVFWFSCSSSVISSISTSVSPSESVAPESWSVSVSFSFFELCAELTADFLVWSIREEVGCL